MKNIKKPCSNWKVSIEKFQGSRPVLIVTVRSIAYNKFIINRTCEIFFLYLSCLYLEFRIVKSSRVTGAWVESTKCWNMWILCSSNRLTNLLSFLSLHASLQVLSGHFTQHIKSCWCSFLVLSLIVKFEPSFAPDFL